MSAHLLLLHITLFLFSSISSPPGLIIPSLFHRLVTVRTLLLERKPLWKLDTCLICSPYFCSWPLHGGYSVKNCLNEWGNVHHNTTYSTQRSSTTVFTYSLSEVSSWIYLECTSDWRGKGSWGVTQPTELRSALSPADPASFLEQAWLPLLEELSLELTHIQLSADLSTQACLPCCCFLLPFFLSILS